MKWCNLNSSLTQSWFCSEVPHFPPTNPNLYPQSLMAQLWGSFYLHHCFSSEWGSVEDVEGTLSSVTEVNERFQWFGGSGTSDLHVHIWPLPSGNRGVSSLFSHSESMFRTTQLMTFSIFISMFLHIWLFWCCELCCRQWAFYNLIYSNLTEASGNPWSS